MNYRKILFLLGLSILWQAVVPPGQARAQVGSQALNRSQNLAQSGSLPLNKNSNLIQSSALASAAAASAVTPAGLKKLISERGLQTVAQVLATLPVEMRSNYVLMFHSESLQQGSLLNPRVLLFSEDGKMVLTFNGNPAQIGFETIEMMSFIDGKNEDRFEFEEIVMPGDLRARKKYLESINAFQDIKQMQRDHQDPNRKGANPRVCLGCHKQDPRPNWNQGNFWSGAYGRIEDAFWGQRMPVRDPITGANTGISDQEEMKALQQFLPEAFVHPRYRHIQFAFHDPAEKRGLKTFNFKFTLLTSELNGKRVARILTRSKYYPRFKVEVMKRLMDCLSPIVDPATHYSELQTLLTPFGVPVWDLSTHFQLGPGNFLQHPRQRDVIPQALLKRDPSLQVIKEQCERR